MNSSHLALAETGTELGIVIKFHSPIMSVSGPRNCTIWSVSGPRIIVAPFLPFLGPEIAVFGLFLGPEVLGP